MPRKAQPETSLTQEEIKTKRISEVAARKKKALEDLAEAQQIEQELGLAAPTEMPEDPSNGLEQAPDRLTEILSEISQDGGYWEAYRVINGARTKLGRFGLDAWPAHLEVLAHAVGGGNIIVQFKRAGGTFAAQQTFNFDPATYKPEASTAAAGPQAPQNSMDRFMELMDRREQQFKAEIAEARKESAELQKTILQSLLNKDPMQSMTAMKTMMEALKPETPKPMTYVKEIFEVLSLLRGHGTELEPPSPMELLITKACDMLAPVLKAGLESRTPLPKPSGAAPAPAETASEPVAAVAPSPADTDIALSFLCENLLTAIRNGASPDTVASAFADKLDVKAAAELKPYTDDPNIADKLIALKAELSQWKVWLVDFAVLMKGYVNDTLNPPQDPEEDAGAN